MGALRDISDGPSVVMAAQPLTQVQVGGGSLVLCMSRFGPRRQTPAKIVHSQISWSVQLHPVRSPLKTCSCRGVLQVVASSWPSSHGMLRTFANIIRSTFAMAATPAPRVPIPRNGVDYRGKIVLAPMVRSGELPSRLMALKYGADLVWGKYANIGNVGSCLTYARRTRNHR